MTAPRSLHRVMVTWIALMLALVVTSCTSKPASSTDPKTRWLNKIPCAAPCWENITPGVDTPNTIRTKLKANPLVDADAIGETDLPQDDALHFLAWGMKSPTGKWDKSQWNGKIVYRKTDADKPIPQLGFTTPDLCLGEIIVAYGEPEYLLLPPYAITGEVDLTWRSKGILFTTRLASAGAEITAKACGGGMNLAPPNTPLSGFAQNDLITSALTGIDPMTAFTPWKGYGKYPSQWADLATP